MQRMISVLGWLSFAVWLLSSPGCGGRLEAWRVEESLSEPAQAALDEWCQYGYCSDIDPAGDFEIRTVSAAEISTARVGEHRSDDRGWHQIVVLAGLPAEQTRVTLLHELGHWYRGHGHLPPGNVMSHYLDDCAEHLTEADIYGSWDLP